MLRQLVHIHTSAMTVIICNRYEGYLNQIDPNTPIITRNQSGIRPVKAKILKNAI